MVLYVILLSIYSVFLLNSHQSVHANCIIGQRDPPNCLGFTTAHCQFAVVRAGCPCLCSPPAVVRVPQQQMGNAGQIPVAPRRTAGPRQIVNPEKALQACCRVQNIKDPDCKRFCRYTVTWEEFLEGAECLPFVGAWQYCTSNAHQNSTNCCIQAGVPSKCLLFCEGRLPAKCKDLLELADCAQNYLQPILQCQKRTAFGSYVRWRRNGAPAGDTCLAGDDDDDD